jgi:hypothetical protein
MNAYEVKNLLLTIKSAVQINYPGVCIIRVEFFKKIK